METSLGESGISRILIMVTTENIKEAIMRVCGIAIVRDKIELSLDELKQIVEIMPQVTGDFPICSICRDDLAGKGYDVEKIDYKKVKTK